MRRHIGVLTLLLTAACASGGARAPLAREGRSDCFPLEQLSAPDRRWATALLLEAADGEALYTLADGLKPISSDGGTLRLRVHPTVDSVALDSLDRLRRITQALHCGEVTAFVALFAGPFPDRAGDSVRIADVVFLHRARTADLVRRHRAFFATLGVTPGMRAEEVVLAVEHAPRIARWRGYGHLFGYPDPAVDFFVRAGARGDSTGQLVPRDFRRVETWRKYPASTGGAPTLSAFVYAVPRGATPDSADLLLAARAAPIFAEYAAARAPMGADSARIVALLRAWSRVGR
ncbi:MAG: hypothetical protein MUF00_00975 [Gemmatimonadaceae bacterium]|jgi:hypothetical protein|nr:hypothetical protein [Gemmatimonadaceae bacterium]